MIRKEIAKRPINPATILKDVAADMRRACDLSLVPHSDSYENDLEAALERVRALADEYERLANA